MKIRPAAVSGSFYPERAALLQADIDGFLRQSSKADRNLRAPKVIIVPHAGYQYSGGVAASAYQLLEDFSDQIHRVILLGPSHRLAFDGIAIPSSDQFETPLGLIELDLDWLNKAAQDHSVAIRDDAHQQEHSLEVQLPFLQAVLNEFTLVPLVVGICSAEDVSRVLAQLWGGAETLIVISTDLSHFNSYENAKIIDLNTTDKILSFSSNISGNEACGHFPLNGLLLHAKSAGMSIHLQDLKNSGDTEGNYSRVVGYGAFSLYESEGKTNDGI